MRLFRTHCRGKLKQATLFISWTLFLIFFTRHFYINNNNILYENNIKRRRENFIKMVNANRSRDMFALANYDNSPSMKPYLAGYLGRPVNIKYFDKIKEREGYKLHAFNLLASDSISLHRTLKDYRNER